jgi:Fe-S oxidoreductase
MFRRYVLKPKTLETRWDDTYALILLAMIPIAGFTLEGTRFVSVPTPWSAWSPVGNAAAVLMRAAGMSPEGAITLHNYFFWIHMALGLGLVASIPFTKLRHLVYTPLNVLFRPKRKQGTLEKIENIDEAEILGVGKVEEFHPQQLLSFDACVRCGRCEEVCPAELSGMPYSPRTFIQSLRTAAQAALVSPNGNGKSKHELLGEALPEETPWFCTTCGACLANCPAYVNPVDEIIDLRRYQVLTTGSMPKPAAEALRNLERQGNPWGMPAQDRMTWAAGLEIRELAPGESTDVLLFLGCAFAFDDRNKKAAQSFVKVLQKMGVDFATLGLDEGCCGETARRLGHEYLFQMLAEQNIAALSAVNFNRIVTQCPHCFNTLKNEYPQMGGTFKVQHYTEYLAELPLTGSAINPNGNGLHAKVAYHDSCYLGRYNGIYEQPRKLLANAKVETVELERSGELSFCCGGGGGQMWLETDAETRINHRRLDDVQKAQAEVVATACPYCLLMFDDAIRSKGLGEKMQVYDVAEVMARQMGI